MHQNALKVLGLSRDIFLSETASGHAGQTKTSANDDKRAEYGLSAELALLDGAGIGQKIVDLSA